MTLRAPVPAPALFLGLATPQANPTVEAEFRLLFRGRLLPVVTRLVSRAHDPARRLLDYLDQLAPALESFDTLPLAAFGFACTGSSYLAGTDAEEAAVRRVTDRFRLPVVTATAAIRAELGIRGARRIAVFAPYPVSLCSAAMRYWKTAGYEVTRLERLETGSEDTRSIYTVTPAAVAAALQRFDPGDADVVLLSGTGMPTLDALLDGNAGPPMISSNLCLAAQMLRRTGEMGADQPADCAALLSDD